MGKYIKEGTTWRHGVCTLSTCQFYRLGCDIMQDTSRCKRLTTYNDIKNQLKLN